MDGPLALLDGVGDGDIDAAFRALATQAAATVGSRDPAVALRMLEDQTIAAPLARADDEQRYWTRILELAALTGEVLRARFGGRWVQSDRAALPFAFQLAGGAAGVAEVYPTNRAQKLADDGRTESLFQIVAAAEEMLARPPDVATGRLMPSLRARDSVELDEVAWRALLGDGAPADVPIVVVGIDGEVTFALMRRESIDAESTVDAAVAAALANLADERVEREVIAVGDAQVIVFGGSFYAAEKVLDRAFMGALQRELGALALAAAMPARGELLVSGDVAHPARLARFVALARQRFASHTSGQISPRVVLVQDGVIVACAETAAAAPTPAPRKSSWWRRWFGRR